MKKTFYLIGLVIALFLCPPAEGKTRKNILYLNSYHNGYSWSDNILAGVRAALKESDYVIDLQIEYMDTKTRYDEHIRQALYEHYRYKYADLRFDAVIVSDNNAFDFILKYGSSLTPSVPVIFCGLNDFDRASIRGLPHITGIVEGITARENLELALSLHPGKSRMVVIGDTSVTGKAIFSQIRKTLPDFEGRLTAEFWTDQSLAELRKKVSALSDDTFIFFSPFYGWVRHQLYPVEEILDELYAHASQPIYSSWRFLLDHGIVGGTLSSGARHGELAAKMALEIFSGKRPSEIPVVDSVDYDYLFDYRVLEKFSIDHDNLPENARIINEPYHFYELDRKVIWNIVGVFCFLVVILFYLVVNIIERRSVEEKIKDQLSFLKILMHTIPIPIYFKDVEGRYQGFNSAFEKWFDMGTDKLMGKTDAVLLDGPSPLADDTDVRLLLRQGVKSYEADLAHQDGTCRHVVLNKATHMNARGEIIGIVGGIYDIHDITQAKKQLQKTEERYRRIFENASRGIVLSTLDGRILSVNPEFARIAGFDSPEAFMAETGNIREFFVSSRVRRVFFSRLREGAGLDDFEMEYYRRDRKVRWATASARPVSDENGKLLYIEGIAEDITERKRAEAAKRESLHKLQAVLDNIPQLVFWQDRSLHFSGGNKSFRAFLGLSEEEEFSGKRFYHALYTAEHAKTMMETDREILASGRARYRIKLKGEQASERFVWLEINKIPLLDERGRITGLLSTAEDVTRKTTLEKQLLQSQKMEAMGILSGGIAHDFNNILTSIINSTELAIEDVAEDSLTRSDLERVLKASRRGSQLVKQILSFSRRAPEEFRLVEMDEIVAEALSLIRTSLPGHIQVSERVDRNVRPCLADPGQIHQIIMNLCTNAFQAMGDNEGVLAVLLTEETITGPPAELLNLAAGRYVKLTITDNGPGISPSIIDKIYDPFFTTKEKGIGTGLGLSVVHGIIKGHGGGIQVNSVAWEKTEFSIYLPLPKGGAEPTAMEQAAPQRGTGKLLFVEDDSEQRQVIPRVLRQLGYRVVVAKNGHRAMEKFQGADSPFDLVITDFDMPGMDGLELARRLAEIAPETPVIIVSGRRRAASLTRTDNIREIVMKPYNRSVIGHVIGKVLNRA